MPHLSGFYPKVNTLKSIRFNHRMKQCSLVRELKWVFQYWMIDGCHTVWQCRLHFVKQMVPHGPSPFSIACSRLRDGGEKSFSKKKCEKRAGAGERQGIFLAATSPFPKLRPSYFRFGRFNTSALYYLRTWHRLRSAQQLYQVHDSFVF